MADQSITQQVVDAGITATTCPVDHTKPKTCPVNHGTPVEAPPAPLERGKINHDQVMRACCYLI